MANKNKNKKIFNIDDTLPPEIQKKKLLRTNPKKLHHKSQKDLRERVIAAKKEALINALRMPPCINQFRTHLPDNDFQEIRKIFKAYQPESKKERKIRIKLEEKEGRKGEKPVIVKSGIRHVTDLVEQKKAKLVLIACDVNPIEIVLFLPTLCKKMNIAYALVKSKYDLGELVGRKSVTTVCLNGVKADKKTKFDSLIKKCNGLFAEKYDNIMTTWGLPRNKEELVE